MRTSSFPICDSLLLKRCHILLLKTSVVKCVVIIQYSYQYPDSASGPEEPITLALISHSVEGDLPTHGTAPPAPNFRPDSSASTSTFP